MLAATRRFDGHRAVDSRDIFRGDILSETRGKRNCVVLVPGGAFHALSFARLVPIPPALGRAVMFVTHNDRFFWMRGGSASEQGKRDIAAIYGLERYHAPEGRGPPKGALVVGVSITRGGDPWLRALRVDGNPFAALMP